MQCDQTKARVLGSIARMPAPLVACGNVGPERMRTPGRFANR